MKSGLQTDRTTRPEQPLVAFTTQGIKQVPITNSTQWKQLWAQSQHAYRCTTDADNN